jgi:mitochondrial fission process protein 1
MVVTKEKVDLELDTFRDTWVRYFGYANEVGEAFGPISPKLVRPSYGVAFGYVFADTYDKVVKAQVAGKTNEHVMFSGIDCFLWQTLASVLIPGKVIQFVTNRCNASIGKSAVGPLIKRWAPTCIGLATIPLIIKPIDDGVDWLFDNTIRTMAPDTASTPNTSPAADVRLEKKP